MTEETKKKRRTIDEQIAELEAKRGTEVRRLMAREKTYLATKAINKRDYAGAVEYLRGALVETLRLCPQTQLSTADSEVVGGGMLEGRVVPTVSKGEIVDEAPFG